MEYMWSKKLKHLFFYILNIVLYIFIHNGTSAFTLVYLKLVT